MVALAPRKRAHESRPIQIGSGVMGSASPSPSSGTFITSLLASSFEPGSTNGRSCSTETRPRISSNSDRKWGDGIGISIAFLWDFYNVFTGFVFRAGFHQWSLLLHGNAPTNFVQFRSEVG